MIKGFAIAAVVGVVLTNFWAELSQGFDGIHIVLTVLALALIWRLVDQTKKRNALKRNSFEAYQSKNPSCCIGGEVACNSCGDHTISTKTCKSHADYWEHSCTVCGNSIFISKK